MSVQFGIIFQMFLNSCAISVKIFKMFTLKIQSQTAKKFNKKQNKNYPAHDL